MGDHVWAREIDVDPSYDASGTAAMFVEARFYGTEGDGPTEYSFDTNIAAWIGWRDNFDGHTYLRWQDITYSKQTTFTVLW